jgi:ABC-type antimicrobial peptide transport system permease subunit
MIFVPWHQGGFQGGFAIRTPRPLASVSSELRAAGLAADPSSQLWSMHSMDELLSEPMAKPRISALLMSAFSGVALLLAAIGLYGVMTSLVRDRTREIGIRVALGAASGRVRREVLGRAAVVIVVGATVGLVVTLATSGVLQSLLFNVSPTDPISLGGATLLLVLVGLVAAYLPARRATRIDPVQALRSE